MVCIKRNNEILGKFQSNQYQDEAEKKITPTESAQYFFHEKVFREKLLNLDLPCYKLRSGQNQKDTKHVGFMLCNSWRQLHGEQLWPFEVNLVLLSYDLKFIFWKFKHYNMCVTLSRAVNADEKKNVIKSDSTHLQVDISYCSQYWALDWFQNGNIKLKSLQVSLFYHYFLLCKITISRSYCTSSF